MGRKWKLGGCDLVDVTQVESCDGNLVDVTQVDGRAGVDVRCGKLLHVGAHAQIVGVRAYVCVCVFALASV